MSNKIKDLRSAYGWSMDRLAQEIGTSISTINRLEKGETELLSEWVPRIASVFGVSVLNVLGMESESKKPEAWGGTTQFQPPAGHALVGFKLPAHRELWVIDADDMSAVGILRGDIVLVDTAKIKPVMGDVVIAVDGNGSAAIRQFIEPALLITNSLAENGRSVRAHERTIQGTVSTRFAAIGPA